MADTRPKHKPNEKHTLDEVLKSLNDLVRNDVLDVPQPAAPQPHPRPSAASMTGVRDIISSLEELLSSDLDFDEIAKRATAMAATPRGARAAAKPTAPPPVTPPAATPSVKAAPPQPAPPPVAPPLEPMFDEALELEFEMEVEPAALPKPTAPETMSESEIAAALEDIEFDMNAGVAPEPAAESPPEPEMTEVEAAPAPEPETLGTEAAAAAESGLGSTNEVPALEFTLSDLALSSPEDAQLDKPSAQTKPSALEAEATALTEEDARATSAFDLEALAGEIVAAPAPSEPATKTFGAGFMNKTASPAEATTHGAAPELTMESVEFVSSAETAKAAKPEKAAKREKPKIATPNKLEVVEASFEDLAPTPRPKSSGGEDGIAEPAEPPALSASKAGQAAAPDDVLVIDLGAPEPEAMSAPFADETTINLESLASTAPVPAKAAAPLPTSAKAEPVSARANAAPSGTDIPVLKDVALAPSVATFTLEPSPSAPPPASKQDLHQMAVRVIAKLNIELRRAGQAQLDVKTINRLQTLLKEALEKGVTK